MRHNLLLGLILTICLGISTYKLSRGYQFDWDQEDDAFKVTEMIERGKPILIGPRVADDSGFFVGPFHYYFLLPFYIFTRNNPSAGAYAVIVINLLTSFAAFLITKKLFSSSVGLISALFFSLNPPLTSWNVMYSRLIALIGFYLFWRYLNQKLSLPILVLIISFFSTVHLVPTSLFFPLIIVIILSRPKFTFKNIAQLFFCLVLPYLPLIIFNFRHQGIILNKIFEFTHHSSPSATVQPFLFWHSFWQSLNVFGVFPQTIERYFSLTLLLLFPFIFRSAKLRWISLVWIITPVLLLSFYRGNISGYYYGLVTPLIFVSLAVYLFRLPPIFTVLILLAFLGKTLFLLPNYSYQPLSLADKETFIRYLSVQTQDPKVYLSYELSPGRNVGFNYLLHYYQLNSTATPSAHLYSLIEDNTQPLDVKVQVKNVSLVRR